MRLSTTDKGLFIGFVGVPGVGKTTLATALAKKLNANIFIEPGEESWPINHNKPWQEQVYKLESWVCESNAKNFSDARRLADAGHMTVADAGIFLINRELINAPCFSYYYDYLSNSEKEVIYKKAKADWISAACPDVFVLLETDEETWLRYLQQRGRSTDTDNDFMQNYLEQQKAIKQAAERFAHERNIIFLVYKNKDLSPDANAGCVWENLKTLLQNKNNECIPSVRLG